jgi:hypothetical protein
LTGASFSFLTGSFGATLPGLGVIGFIGFAIVFIILIVRNRLHLKVVCYVNYQSTLLLPKTPLELVHLILLLDVQEYKILAR